MPELLYARASRGSDLGVSEADVMQSLEKRRL